MFGLWTMLLPSGLLDSGKQKTVGMHRISPSTSSMPQYFARVLGGWTSFVQLCFVTG